MTVTPCLHLHRAGHVPPPPVLMCPQLPAQEEVGSSEGSCGVLLLSLPSTRLTPQLRHWPYALSSAGFPPPPSALSQKYILSRAQGHANGLPTHVPASPTPSVFIRTDSCCNLKTLASPAILPAPVPLVTPWTASWRQRRKRGPYSNPTLAG